MPVPEALKKRLVKDFSEKDIDEALMAVVFRVGQLRLLYPRLSDAGREILRVDIAAIERLLLGLCSAFDSIPAELLSRVIESDYMKPNTPEPV